MAIKKNRRVTLPQVGIFADGVAVAQIGKNTWEILKDTIDDVITATPDEICAAIKDVFDDTRAVCEPAGALRIAGIKNYIEREGWENQNIVTVRSGDKHIINRLGDMFDVVETHIFVRYTYAFDSR